jgi:hypothetical protein
MDPLRLDGHRRVRESIGTWLAGGLTGPEAEWVGAHVRSCIACSTDAAELRPVVGLLRNLRPAAIRQLHQPVQPVAVATPHPAASARRANRGRRLSRWIVALAAALVLFAAGVGSGWAAFRSPAGPPSERIRFAAAPQGVIADGRLVAHTWGTEASLVISGLPAGGTYTVAFEANDGSVVEAGSFIGVSGRPVVCSMNAAIPRADVASIRITDSNALEVLGADLTQQA